MLASDDLDKEIHKTSRITTEMPAIWVDRYHKSRLKLRQEFGGDELSEIVLADACKQQGQKRLIGHDSSI